MRMLALKREWTADDIQDLPDDGNRYEVIDGELFVSPSPSCKRAVPPDIFVVPLVNGRRPERFDDVKQLRVGAEVLSPSTARADRVAKRALFRDERVAENWIVDLDSRTFERSRPSDPRTEVLSERLEWFPEGASRPLFIDLVEYFA